MQQYCNYHTDSNSLNSVLEVSFMTLSKVTIAKIRDIQVGMKASKIQAQFNAIFLLKGGAHWLMSLLNFSVHQYQQNR